MYGEIHHESGRHVQRLLLTVAGLGIMWLTATLANAQVQITEIMFDPITEGTWEWVEIRNTSGAVLNLDGWIFDDDDDSKITIANIVAANGNTMVPAGGVAVLYNGTDLGFDPTRFNNAWGGGITLVPVSGFTSLSAGDAIGLWNSLANYTADDLMTTSSPRRSFGHAVASVNFATTNGYPSATNGHSIAWRGTGNIATGANWVTSANGGLGAHVSVQTTLPGTPLNNVADRGTPGTIPGGGASPGLVISEVMYDPASAEPAWEWVEVLNNSGASINFSSTPYVFDDDDDGSLPVANITAGSLAPGEVGVLFNASGTGNTIENMKAAWGDGINFIPVTAWTDLTNTGDTIAIWSSLSAYLSETQSTTAPRRTTTHAAAVVAYDDDGAAGWSNNNDAGSIFLANLTSNPAAGSSWLRATNANSATPQPVLSEVVDHPGGDVGSPGHVPGVATTLSGDYNGNGIVDTADYILWRHALQTATALPHDSTPESVSTADYDVWRANFGQAAAAGSFDVATVPEPTTIALATICGLAASFLRKPR